MQVQVLISSYRDSIADVPRVVDSVPKDADILVVHQTGSGAQYDYSSLFGSRNVEVIPSLSSGLAKSRNLAVSLATGDILIPTDDDVRFLPGSFQNMMQAFADNSNAQILSFQRVSNNGQTYVPYKSHSFRHNVQTIRRVSSIELAVRREAFTEYGLRWDENFGLNARYPGGLEQAFMKNALDLGLPAYYCPIPIIEHPADSTGFHHTSQSGFYRGAVYAKLYGKKARAILIAFALKNAWRAGSFTGGLQYTRNLFAGANDYLSKVNGSI